MSFTDLSERAKWFLYGHKFQEASTDLKRLSLGEEIVYGNSLGWAGELLEGLRSKEDLNAKAAARVTELAPIFYDSAGRLKDRSYDRLIDVSGSLRSGDYKNIGRVEARVLGEIFDRMYRKVMNSLQKDGRI